MNWDDARNAMQDAKRTMDTADNIATDLARMLTGRLRKINADWLLKELKVELQDYNAHTKRWKS